MPRVIPYRLRNWKDDDMVVAWETFSGSNLERVIHRGERLRGSDPVVKAHPQYFVLDGTPQSECRAIGTR